MNVNFALNIKDASPFVFSNGDQLTAEKQVIYVGNFYQSLQDEWFPVTESDIDNWVSVHEQFNQDGINVPLPEEHNELPSFKRGDVLSLSKRTDEKGRLSLYAKVKFKDAKAKSDFSASQVSLFCPPEFVSGTGKRYHRPITHLALTDYPVVPDLEGWKTIVASNLKTTNKDNLMNLKTIAKALGLTLADDATDQVMSDAITAQFSTMASAAVASTSEITELKAKLATAIAAATADPANPPPAPILPGILSMAKDARGLKIDQLVTSGNITPAVAAKLKEQYTTDSTLSFSLNSTSGTGDGFDAVIATLQLNNPVDLKEKTGPQMQFSTNPDDSATDNGLTRLAKRKAEAFNG